jgi:Domain of unknown function (DUF3597)
MGMFTNLMSKIFGHATVATSSGAAPGTSTVTSATTMPKGPPTAAAPSSGAAPSAPAAVPPTTTVAAEAPTTAPSPAASAVSSPPAAAPPAIVDVTAILDGLAAKNPEKLDWRKSIVDLMKLVGIDSSLSARKQLAAELHYSGDEKDSAAMNVWLHKEVLKKIAENGGKVPEELLS